AQITSNDNLVERLVALLPHSQRLEFERMTTLNGLWAGGSPYAYAHLETDSGQVGKVVIDAPHRDTWSYTISYRTNNKDRTIFPFLNILIMVPPSTLHNWIEVYAEMRISFPIANDVTGRSFHDETKRVSNSTRFFVVTPQEYGLIYLSRRLLLLAGLAG